MPTRAFRPYCIRRISRIALTVASFLAITAASSASAEEELKARQFLFTYQATVTGLEPGKSARLWLPVPPTNEEQEAALITKDLPTNFTIGSEPKYGNRMLYAELPANSAGTIEVAVTYRIDRKEVAADDQHKASDLENLRLFLQPDAKVPVGGKPLELLEGRDLPKDELQVGRVLYDVVNGHMRYSKEGIGWGQGDAVWACDSKYGNCSDFHSLFISLARAQAIPAKFEMGFPLPAERGEGEIPGYHCWAKFKPAGRGWVPVDISEANKEPKLRDYYFGHLSENRVAFSVGRDLTLVPKQDGPPLNFFIYPYVEVDGVPHPAEKVQRRFTYRDVPCE
jgi:transglutaminase-like putative cysteine protease